MQERLVLDKNPESAIRGGSFWTRIRLGKAVAGSGVRGTRAAGMRDRRGAGEARFGAAVRG